MLGEQRITLFYSAEEKMMVLLYTGLICMLALAITFLVIALPRKKIAFYLAGILVLFALPLYFLFGSAAGLSGWLARGQTHYNLLVEVNRLGGMDVIVKRIAAHLAAHPNDANGWMILGKIWLSEHQYAKAQAAFSRVIQLEPNNQTAKQLLQAASPHVTRKPAA
jgi:cytochrome c-type biogenesis protein CcmH